MPTVGPLCQCGCGEHLPVGSMRNYKRGHRARVNKVESRKVDKELGVFDGYNFHQEPIPERIDAWDAMPFEINPDGSFSMEDAIASTPNDPDTDIWAHVDPRKDLPIEALRDIEGKLAFMLSTPAMMLNVIDPICGKALMESTPQMAKALTPLIAQSPGIVQWFSKTSNIMLYINLAMASWPVLSAIWSHHFAKHEDSNNPFVSNGQMDIPTNAYMVR